MIKDNDKVVKYPTDLGCTGFAIQSKEFYYFNPDQAPTFFSKDIDNCAQVVSGVKSLLVIPIIDDSDRFYGVIQLVNKNHDEPIIEKDILELKQLIPALGQIFKTVDDLHDVENVTAAVKMYLARDTHIDPECVPDDGLMG